jgi:tRNA-2-methylthio-N6-dimethylallyladenosine synthase
VLILLKKDNKMKVFFKGFNACLGRRPDIVRYMNYITQNGHELVAKPEFSDLILIWSCGFRKDFADNVFNMIQEYQEHYGEDKVIVCGCLPAIDEQQLQSVFFGRYFRWNEDNENLKTIFGSNNTTELKNYKRVISEESYTKNFDKFWKESDDSTQDASYYDQFAKIFISEGCSYNCSYCAEKLAFPQYQSFNFDEILNECRMIVDKKNENKIALIGDSLGEYGHDIDKTFQELLEAILNIRDDVQLSLINLNPTDFNKNFEYLVGLIKENRLFDCLVPMQSGSDKILRMMNRTYSKEDLSKIFQSFNDLGFNEWTTHVIIGFNSETDEDFQETIDLILKYKPKYVMASNFMQTDEMKDAKIGYKIDEEVVYNRMVKFAEIMRNNQIICNYNGSEYAQKRNERRKNSSIFSLK